MSKAYITERKIRQVRSQLRHPYSLRQVALKTGVSYATVWKISKGLVSDGKILKVPKPVSKEFFDWADYDTY
jgi:DNA invertase Pin-like site-specific DNA recombinase